MSLMFGIIFLFAVVFGTFIFHGGNPKILIDALPMEFVTIFGAGIAGLIIANKVGSFPHFLKILSKLLKGTYWNKNDQIDAVVLSNRLLKIWKTSGAAVIETHIEDPTSSDIFLDYPKLAADARFVSFLADNIRVLINAGNSVNGYHFSDLLNKNLKLRLEEEMHAVHSLNFLAGAFPALGIVACVLGIVKTMESIDQPPAILGSLIAAALVGTFLGIFLSYGIVEPCSIRLKAIIEKDENIYHVAKEILVANVNGFPEILMIESVRNCICIENQPTFDEVFNKLHG